MTRYVALLRAVNVGGTGSLPMAKLASACTAAGFADVQTYLASGNVLLTSPSSSAQVAAKLLRLLTTLVGKPVVVVVRTAAEMRTVQSQNPFPDADPSRAVAFFLGRTAPAVAQKSMVGQRDEQVRAGNRVLYVHYPSGQGRSKLRFPGAADGTARNMNTIAGLVDRSATE